MYTYFISFATPNSFADTIIEMANEINNHTTINQITKALSTKVGETVTIINFIKLSGDKQTYFFRLYKQILFFIPSDETKEFDSLLYKSFDEKDDSESDNQITERYSKYAVDPKFVLENKFSIEK